MACGTLSKVKLDSDDRVASRYSATGDLAQEVKDLAEPLVSSGLTPGVVVGVLTADGSRHFFAFGVGATDGRGLDKDTLFPVGSLSKGFLVAIVATLVNEGVLSWSDTLGSLLPSDIKLSDYSKTITLEQLATHTSGLPRQPMTLQTLSYFVQYLFTGQSFYRHFDRDYVLEYLSTFEEPAEKVPQYSNIGQAMLGHVIEIRTGKRLDELLSEKLVKPLNLSATGYQPTSLPGYERRAIGHAGDQPKFIRRGKPVPDWTFTEILKGSAAAYSTADDLLRFADAHLHPERNELNRILADNLRVRFSREREAAAMAWMEDSVDGHKISYLIGFVAGYSGFLGLDRKHRTAVVVLQNSFNWSEQIGHRLLRRMARAELHNQLFQ